ncbi:hypothetical protein E4U41_005108, partial [Claviceps citrina]
ELDAVVPARSPRADLSARDLDNLPYMQAIVRESLRLSFAAPGFNREPIPQPSSGSSNSKNSKDSKAPVPLAGGKYLVPHNQPIIVLLAGANRDPAVFDEPLAFRPERMLGDRFDALPEGARKWFGTGKRACIGRDYAWQWSVLVLAMLVRRVDFALEDGAGAGGYELVRDGWFNYRPVGLRMKVRVRD